MRSHIYCGILIVLLITSLTLTIAHFNGGSFGSLFVNIPWLASVSATVWIIWSRADIVEIISWFIPNPNKKNDQHENSVTHEPSSLGVPISLTEEQDGYQTLTSLCTLNSSYNDLHDYFRQLKTNPMSKDVSSTLDQVIELSDERGFDFIILVDWKVEPEDVDYIISKILDQHHAIAFKGPNLNNFGEEAIVANEGVWETFDAALRKHELQLGFIDTQSDEYVFFIHFIDDIETAREAVQKIGYKYFEKRF